MGNLIVEAVFQVLLQKLGGPGMKWQDDIGLVIIGNGIKGIKN